MTDLSVAERIFLLRSTRAFGRLYDSEIGSIALACRHRTFRPGEVVARAGRPLRQLHLVATGAVVDERAGPLPRVFGASSLLTGHALEAGLRADPVEGASCLLLSRPHFFTLVNEYPPLLVSLLEDWREEFGGS